MSLKSITKSIGIYALGLIVGIGIIAASYQLIATQTTQLFQLNPNNPYLKQQEQHNQQCLDMYHRVSLVSKSCYDIVVRYLEQEVYTNPKFAKKHRLWACEMRKKGYNNPFIKDEDCYKRS